MNKELKKQITEALREGWFSWEDEETISFDDLDVILEVRE